MTRKPQTSGPDATRKSDRLALLRDAAASTAAYAATLTCAENRAGPPRPHDPTPAASVSVDAELLGLAAEFQRTDARLMAINAEIQADTTGTMSMDKGEPAAVHDRWWAIVNEVIDTPAFTVPGWAAKGGIFPAVLRDLASLDSDTADHRLTLSLVLDMQRHGHPELDAELLAACEVFHVPHREMKAARGDSPETEAALGRAMDAWYAALATVKAAPARTAAGQREKAGVVYTALNDVLPLEQEDGNREEFAALTFLAELLGLDPETLPAIGAPAAPEPPASAKIKADTAAEEYDLDSLLAAAEDADSAFFDMETVFLDMRADIEIIKHVARTEATVSVDAWMRIHDHLDLACDTLETSWSVARERRQVLSKALTAERAERKALERARIEDAQPGSAEDRKNAEAMWTMLRTLAKLALTRCDEAMPTAA
jgi:hypothetical protein